MGGSTISSDSALIVNQASTAPAAAARLRLRLRLCLASRRPRPCHGTASVTRSRNPVAARLGAFRSPYGASVRSRPRPFCFPSRPGGDHACRQQTALLSAAAPGALCTAAEARLRSLASTALLALLSGATRSHAPQLDPASAPEALRPALARAEAGIRAAACDAERRFGEGDPDSNAARCERAEPVAGVEVGRTSARLRNPRNAPPEWARRYVSETDGRKAADVAAVAFDLGDRVGLLRPVAIRSRCLGCHARKEDLAEGTREWLSRAYPKDRALGYALGDLRGFWWAEAPKGGAP